MRKRTKRKVWALIDPCTHAIVGASITHRDKLDKLRMMEYSALEAMTKGQGTIHDWRTLVDVLNLSETMARNNIGKDEVMPVCQKAQDALHQASERYQKTKKMGLSGEGIQAVRDLIQYADLQQSSIAKREQKFLVSKKPLLMLTLTTSKYSKESGKPWRKRSVFVGS